MILFVGEILLLLIPLSYAVVVLPFIYDSLKRQREIARANHAFELSILRSMESRELDRQLTQGATRHETSTSTG